MKGKVYIAGLLLLLSLSLLSCGGGGGAPGTGSGETQIQVQSILLSAESNDIDVFQSATACDGEPEDPLTDALVTMNITAAAFNPDPTFSPFPANIEYCFVTYTAGPLGSPIIESKTIFPNCTFIEGETSCDLDLINIARKTQWWDDLVSGKFDPAEYPTKYTVIYDCRYQNNFREDGKLGGRIDIDLADWLSCGG